MVGNRQLHLPVHFIIHSYSSAMLAFFRLTRCSAKAKESLRPFRSVPGKWQIYNYLIYYNNSEMPSIVDGISDGIR